MGLCVSKTPPSSFTYIPVSLKLFNIYSLGFSKPSRRKFCSVNEGSFQEYSILKRKTPLLTLNDLLDFYSCFIGLCVMLPESMDSQNLSTVLDSSVK